ncbi:helix-turn-helix transcriptional regulator [Gordonia sputi]
MPHDSVAPLPPTANDSILTTKQVVERFPFLNESTLRYWRMNDTGPASFSLRGRVLYRLSEIQRWIAAEEAKSTRGGAA